MFNGNNAYFPYGPYNPYTAPAAAPQPTITQQMSFVNGIEGAKGFIVQPNTSAFLMDSDSDHFYLKTADRNGMCNIKVYKYEEETPNSTSTPDLSAYATKEEVAQLAATLQVVLDKVTALEARKPLI